MFRGTTSHTIDSKGRLIIPMRFREVIQHSGGDLMITRMDGALWAFTFPEWDKLETRVLNRQNNNEEMRRFRRFFIGSAMDCRCDKQGRVLLPPYLREMSGIKKNIMLVGQLKHFEIWDREKYELDYQQFDIDSQKEEVRKEIAEWGL